MKESVIQHALQNAWSNPLVDSPVRLKPARVTGINGEFLSFSYFNRRVVLPNREDRFHIYHIGVYHNDAVLLTSLSPYVWTNMDDLVTNEKVIFNGYTDDGMLIPNHDIFAILSPDNDLMLAVRNRKHYDIYSKTFFVRFQQAAYYGSEENDQSEASVSKGMIIKTDSELISLRQTLANYESMPGHTFVYKNGYLVDSDTIRDAAIGTNLSFVYDSSIKAVLDFKLDELDTYLSAKDGGIKYLLHPKKSEFEIDTVNYIDDVDFYLVHKGSEETRGTLIYKHSVRDYRSLTHRDWGLNYDLVQFLMDITKPVSGYYIRAYVRHSGQGKRINHSEDRLHEFYKMDDRLIYECLTGHNAIQPDWTATALESSHYVDMVATRYKDFDVHDVIRGYGYVSLVKGLGKSVFEMTESNMGLDHAVNENVTVFEFDLIGNFLGYYYHPAGSSYIASNSNCKYITIQYGKPSSEFSWQDNHSTKTLDKNQDIRVFDCAIQGGKPTREWEEITNDVEKYQIGSDGKVNWNIDVDGRYAVVVDNSSLKIQHFTVIVDDGIIELDIASETGLEPEATDVFLANKHLSLNIDYFRIGNEIVITNTKFIDSTKPVTFTVVCKGVKSTELKHQITDKTGFVVNGKIGVDEVYDLKDDKVLFCYIDGRLILQEDIAWEEGGAGLVKPTQNGLPFSIIESYVALPKLVDYDHYPRRQYSKEKDLEIGALFTGLGMVEKQSYPSVITDYVLFSPFMSYIINDITKGLKDPLAADDTEANYNDWCERYFKYLDYDPCALYTDKQMQFVKIVPSIHNSVTVTSEMFGFLQRVNELYLRDRIILRDNVLVQ